VTAAARPTGPGQVPSPCNGVCRIDAASGWCEGCRRSLDEITAWSNMSDDQRRDVWRVLPARHAVATHKS
jgi:predicted Fe-S protein YdhL (DUF1289 family)